MFVAAVFRVSAGHGGVGRAALPMRPDRRRLDGSEVRTSAAHYRAASGSCLCARTLRNGTAAPSAPVDLSPLLAPSTQGRQRGKQILTFLRESIAHLALVLFNDRSFQYSRTHQAVQSIRENVSRDVQMSKQRFEMFDTLERCTDDKQRPPVADILERRKQCAFVGRLRYRLPLKRQTTCGDVPATCHFTAPPVAAACLRLQTIPAPSPTGLRSWPFRSRHWLFL